MNIAERIAGVWRLLRYEIRNSDGAIELPFGDAVTGLLIYTRDGYMSGQVMRNGRAAPLEGYIAYCGTWRVEEERGEVIHAVEASLLPKWAGSEQRRRVRFAGDDMLTLTAPFVKDGEAREAVLHWRRASDR